MSPDQLAFWLQLLSALGVGGVIAALVVAYFLRSYIPTYIAKKAENLATREDIEEITRKVESVRSEYAVLVEELKARHQLKLAALDDRLRAHQEAFTHWRRLNRAAHDGDDSALGERIRECQAWWEENCLYLNAESREAFPDAYWAAQHLYRQAKANLDPNHEIKIWERLSRVGDVLVKSVQLPTLGEAETRDVLRGKDG